MAGKTLKEMLAVLKSQVEKSGNSITLVIDGYKTELKAISEVIAKVEESWSGSWIGFHASLYFKGFKKPRWEESFNSEWGSINGIPESWEEKSYEDVAAFIERDHQGSSISNMLTDLQKKAEQAKLLQENLCTELSVIRDFASFDKDVEVLEKIESIKWRISAPDFIKYREPTQIWSRDTFAMSQGVKTPPHIEYQANVLYCFSVISNIENLMKLSNRLIRQIEIRQPAAGTGTPVANGVSTVLAVCSRFHLAARQLTKRHEDRPTLKIADEYDVQDLLHSLLKLHFDDIRPEEWVPSYAGSSSKMDFLLKKEKIVIEVKKTRENLTDKKIGEQLLVDIAKYRHHADCNTLICFIYDPEERIENPRGLENDLSKLSNDTIRVVAIVEPS